MFFFLIDLKCKVLREGHSAIILVPNLLEPALPWRGLRDWINWLVFLLHPNNPQNLVGGKLCIRLNAWLTGKSHVLSVFLFSSSSCLCRLHLVLFKLIPGIVLSPALSSTTNLGRFCASGKSLCYPHCSSGFPSTGWAGPRIRLSQHLSINSRGIPREHRHTELFTRVPQNGSFVPHAFGTSKLTSPVGNS